VIPWNHTGSHSSSGSEQKPSNNGWDALFIEKRNKYKTTVEFTKLTSNAISLTNIIQHEVPPRPNEKNKIIIYQTKFPHN
jgi:hypothetical protein